MSPFVRGLARRHARSRIRSGLDGLFVSGLDTLRATLAAGPAVLAANHVCWWDGLVALVVDQEVGADSRLIVDAPSLERLPWLRWIGALPIDRSTPWAAGVGLRRAARHLDGPGKALWIFPQGRERAAHLRPLGFGPGADLLARLTGAPVVPVSLSYPFRDKHVPSSFVSILRPVVGGGAAVEREIVASLDALDQERDAGLVRAPWIEPRRGAAQDGIGARTLGVWARWSGGRRG